MSEAIEIPEEILEIISYFSEVFARSIHHPVYAKEDLYNELVVAYLENLSSGKVKKVDNKNHWFIFFKTQMLDLYKRVSVERRVLERVSEECIQYFKNNHPVRQQNG
jgi:hypothetical protein